MDLALQFVFDQCALFQRNLRPFHAVFVPVTFEYHNHYTELDTSEQDSDVTTNVSAKTTLRYVPPHSARLGISFPRFVLAPASLSGTFNGEGDTQAIGSGGSYTVTNIHLFVSGGFLQLHPLAEIAVQCHDSVIMDFHRELDIATFPVTFSETTHPGSATSFTTITVHFDAPVVRRTNIASAAGLGLG